MGKDRSIKRVIRKKININTSREERVTNKPSPINKDRIKLVSTPTIKSKKAIRIIDPNARIIKKENIPQGLNKFETRNYKRTGNIGLPIKYYGKSGLLNMEDNLIYNKYMKEKLGILIVNYNNLQYTKNLINNLDNQINKSFEIWLVDQNSNEKGTEEYLKLIGHNPLVKIYRNKINQDLNRVWNWYYETNNSEYLCYLNNDVEVTNNFTDDILNTFRIEEQVGIVIHPTNSLNYTKPESITNYMILKQPKYQGWDFTIRRKLYKKIPDNMRIFGGDDLLFAYVVHQGYNVAVTLSSPIIHYKERTRIKINNIGNIQKLDAHNYWNEIHKNNLPHVDTTMGTEYCNKYPPENIKLTQNKNCIYTTIIGNYDILAESTKGKLDNWDYICFTDNLNLKSDFWKIVYIENSGNTLINNYKKARFMKTNFFKYLSSYDNIIWKDGRIEINTNLNNYLKNLNEYDIVFMKHPDVNSIEAEYGRVLLGKLETEDLINKIKEKYKKENYKYDNGLMASGIILFKNNINTINFFKDWWNEIDEFSYRDQLSANYVLSKHKNLKHKYLPFAKVLGNNSKSYFKPGKRISNRLTF